MSFLVPESELEFRASRAGGPGGQHVNKTSTRVEVLWDVARSPSLDQHQRERLLQRLRSRIDGAGVIHVVAAERRSQLRNRQAAVDRLQKLVDQGLHIPAPRKPTRPTRAAREKRIAGKRRRAEAKKRRRHVSEDD